MADAREADTHGSTVDAWTRALAEATGSPGGGAGAGVMLAIAASLMSMVAGYTDATDARGPTLESLAARAQALREDALALADADSTASAAFGAAFRLERGPRRDEAIRAASVQAASTSAEVGDRAVAAVADLEWLAWHGNRALIADVVVAGGALRAALTGARTNVSFDLGSLTASGLSLPEVHRQHPALWADVQRFDAALARLDHVLAAVDDRAAPTVTPSASAD